MKNIFEKVSAFADRAIRFLIYGILGFSLFGFAVCIVRFPLAYPNQFSVREIVWIIPAAALMCGIYFAGRFFQNKKECRLVITMVGIEIIFGIVMILTYNTRPVTDYSNIWKGANEMAVNAFTDGITPGTYFYNYTWQIGITAFESIFVRIFGSDFTVLKIFNCILIIATDYIVYRLCKSQFGYKTACYAYVLSAAFMPWVMSIPQFTNHHIGILFLLSALWLINKDKWYTYLIAGVLTALLNVVRPLGIIVVLSAVCFAAYRLIKTLNWKYIIKIAALILAYMIVLTAFNRLFISLNYTDMNVSEARVPYFKFQKGLYGYDWPQTAEFDNDYEAYNAAMKTELTGKITHEFPSVVVFVTKKMITYLGLFDYQFEMTYNHDMDFWTQYPVKALYSTSWFQYIAMLVISLYGAKKYFAKFGGIDIYQVFFIGNTFVYIFIEAFSSYRFESYFFLIILTAAGFSGIEKRISKK